MTQTKKTKNRILQNSWKKWLVFSLAFCLSLLFLQLQKPEVQPDSVELPSNPVISENLSTVRSEYQISVENRALFKDLLDKFQNAVAKNDKETVVSLVSFPVDVEFVKKPYYKEVRTEKEFLQNYDRIFDDPLKQCISQIDTDKLLFVTNGTVFVARGNDIIVRMERFNNNDSESFEVKIIDLFRCKYQ
jgi:hypothetical protein